MAANLIKNSYGKEAVRLTHVTRGAERKNLVRQLTVGVELEGDFEETYRTGDNRQVVATDSMKNTVYVLARGHKMGSIEEFGRDLAGHFVDRYGHVSAAIVRIEEQIWDRVQVNGVAHPTAFVGRGGEVRTCRVKVEPGRNDERWSGLDGLLVLKTTDSAFVEFMRDEFATLPDAEDRLMSTVIKAEWRYGGDVADWNDARDQVRSALVGTFAAHRSLSVQQTLLAMGEAALEACGVLKEIELILPNKHHIPLNLAGFGLDNPDLLYMPTDEPYGCIRGTVRRQV